MISYDGNINHYEHGLMTIGRSGYPQVFDHGTHVGCYPLNVLIQPCTSIQGFRSSKKHGSDSRDFQSGNALFKALFKAAKIF